MTRAVKKKLFKSQSPTKHENKHSFWKLLPSALSPSLSLAYLGARPAQNCNADVSGPEERSVS